MDIQIPNRSLFRQPEVCEIAQVQSYVLRSWEAEFPDLGVVRGSARVYRKADLERVLRIKQLLFVDGLTLAGVRRKLAEEVGPSQPDSPALDDLLSSDARERLRSVRQSLHELAVMLGGKPSPPVEREFALAAPAAAKRAPAKKSGASAAKKR